MTSSLMRRRAICVSLLFVAFSFCARPSAGQGDPREQGSPKSLILTYKCSPSQRVALRKYMSQTGLANLDDFKAHGFLSAYRLLFSRYVDNDNWDMMLIVSFRDESSLDHWRDVERQSPAGLSVETLARLTSVSTTPADLLRNSLPAVDDRRSVFLVIPYDYTVSTPEYVRYVDGYVIPQLEGWRDELVLAHYELYLVRYGASRPWSSLLLLQYVDSEALGARDRIVAKVREKLKENASWKAFADNKQSVRIEKQAIISDELKPAPR